MKNKRQVYKKKSIKKLLTGSSLWLLIIIMLAVCGIIGVNLYVRGSIKNRIIKSDKASELDDVDCILVLGASVVNGDTPSPMLKDRLDKAVELYFSGTAAKLIMSGDHGSEYYNEVQVMKDYAISKGVPAEDIFMDHAGFSTYESMYRAKKIFGADKLVIVTQKYHLYRSLYIADKLDIDAYGVAAVDTKYSGQTKRDIRECLAIFKDFLKTVAKPEPALMGSPIDLKGNGNVTND